MYTSLEVAVVGNVAERFNQENQVSSERAGTAFNELPYFE
jgi:hypothetical protein